MTERAEIWFHFPKISLPPHVAQPTRAGYLYHDMPEEPEDEFEGLESPPSFFPYSDDTIEPVADLGEPVEVTVEGVFYADTGSTAQNKFVLLSDGERRVPIMIGPAEAAAISLSLEHEQPDRPLTHDLLKLVIDRLDSRVVRVVIDDLFNKTYYAKIYLELDGEEMDLDSRPSDAIALALRAEAPIFVRDGILNQITD